MNKFVELPLIEPLYATYNTGIITAAIAENPSIRNWFLNNAISLVCNRKFLHGFTSPQLSIENYLFSSNCFDKKWISMKYLNGYINHVIRNLIDLGYYVYFNNVDNYYVRGKSGYKQIHLVNDGTICGYNQKDKTYCIYAYDENWILQKFWTPQSCFNRGREAMFQKGIYGNLLAIKPKKERFDFSVETVLEKIKVYLDSNLEKYPFDGEGDVCGIVVHEYIAKYIEKLADNSIPYAHMDKNIFRLLLEHKKVMFERIVLTEQSLELGDEISEKYKMLISKATSIRKLYSPDNIERNKAILLKIKRNLLSLMDVERELLLSLVQKIEGEMKNGQTC